MLKTMESRLGAQLFSRTSRGMVLTDKGETLYKFAKAILKQTADLRFGAESDDGPVRISTYESICDLVAPRLLEHLAAERFQLTCQVSGLKLIDLLVGGETDYIVLADPPKVRGVTFEKLVDSRYCLYATKEYLDQRGRLKPEAIAMEQIGRAHV